MISTLIDHFVDASSRKRKERKKVKSRSKRLGMGYPLTVSLSIDIDGSMNGKMENVENAAKEALLPRMWL